MLPALLITFREVLEATLIVATILGILVKLGQNQSLRTVWLATVIAAIFSAALVGLGSFTGIKIQELYLGKTKQLIEGALMLTSAVFITWAVFWLHKYFARQKLRLLQSVKQTIQENQPRGLFVLVFTAVFREGIEIALFLSTIYLSTSPISVFAGFGIGTLLALLISVLVFTTALKLPIFRAFQATTLLLVLFAAGLAGRGVQELSEAGLFHSVEITLSLLPPAGSFLGDTIQAVFGWSRVMTDLHLLTYAIYISFMRWYLYVRRSATISPS